MKQIQHTKWVSSAGLWKPALVLLLALFSLQLWGEKEAGWDLDLGMGMYGDGAVIQGNYRVQTTIPLGLGNFRIGGEIRFPVFYSLVDANEFLSTGFMAGPRLSIKSEIIELMVTGTYGPQGLLLLSDKTDLDVKLVGAVDYIIKMWADDDLAVYFNYNRTYGLAKESFGSLVVGISLLTSY